MITEYTHTIIKNGSSILYLKKNSERKVVHATKDLGGKRKTKAKMGMEMLKETEIANV